MKQDYWFIKFKHDLSELPARQQIRFILDDEKITDLIHSMSIEDWLEHIEKTFILSNGAITILENYYYTKTKI